MPVFSRGRGRGGSQSSTSSGHSTSYRGRGAPPGWSGRAGRIPHRGAPPNWRGRVTSRGSTRGAIPSLVNRSSSTSTHSQSNHAYGKSVDQRYGNRVRSERGIQIEKQKVEEEKGEDEDIESRIGGKREGKEWRLRPEDVVDEFKRQGHFDALRKVLLSQFSTSTLKEPLLKSIESNLLRSLEKDLILKVEDEIHGTQETPVHPSSNSSPSKSRNREKSGSGKWGRGRDNGYGGKGIASGSGSGSGSGSNHQAILGGGLTQEELNKKVQSAAQGIMEIDARLRHAESLKTLEKSQIFEDLVTKLKYNSYLEGESSKEIGEKDQEDSKQTTVKEEGKEESKDQSQREKEENFQVQALLSRKNRIGKSVGESLINVIKSERKRLRREEREERGEGSGSEEEEEDAGNTDEEESESGGEDQEMKVEDDQEEK